MKKNHIISVLVDLRKAFDTLNHSILLKKLENYGVRGVGLEWFRTYLAIRKQFVVVNGVKPSLNPVSIGVLEGSIIELILFLIFINDLIRFSNELQFVLFADDTIIALNNNSFSNLSSNLKLELEHMFGWVNYNRLILNLNTYYSQIEIVRLRTS